MPRIVRTMQICALAAAGAGCTPQVVAMNGDANGVDVTYAGDLAASTDVARNHCAQYGRVPRYIGKGTDHVYFECDRL
jgi:hypothetical protein